ncbi:hypothetical protein CC2G_006312 [Coprinopsis cinerea AmutBmut pab1-1]|nr:hypothetical protein CC2G_006312 [Coprinopsis cinerea AmutBmut pab1-1]
MNGLWFLRIRYCALRATFLYVHIPPTQYRRFLGLAPTGISPLWEQKAMCAPCATESAPFAFVHNVHSTIPTRSQCTLKKLAFLPNSTRNLRKGRLRKHSKGIAKETWEDESSQIRPCHASIIPDNLVRKRVSLALLSLQPLPPPLLSFGLNYSLRWAQDSLLGAVGLWND